MNDVLPLGCCPTLDASARLVAPAVVASNDPVHEFILTVVERCRRTSVRHIRKTPLLTHCVPDATLKYRMPNDYETVCALHPFVHGCSVILRGPQVRARHRRLWPVHVTGSASATDRALHVSPGGRSIRDRLRPRARRIGARQPRGC